MPLGWIDFSKSERSKVLTVLDLLSESATLDELGVAPIRDGFANMFFPGTSTIQTRAKYFFVVPYALRDFEKSPENNPNRIEIALDQRERACGERFLANNADEDGVIGKRSLAGGRWVKRSPADIYWAGLRRYGIFTGGNLSLGEYIRLMCAQKSNKSNLRTLGNRRDNSEESECDDERAGVSGDVHFLHMPLYTVNWFETLSMALTTAEGQFLKEQILLTCPDSMMAYILKYDMQEILQLNNFGDLQSLLFKFPDEIQRNYKKALAFSDFVYAIRTVYNIIISDGENEDANAIYEDIEPHLAQIASIDIDDIFSILAIYNNPMLRNFLRQAQTDMMANDLDNLKLHIQNREVYLKGQSRSKAFNHGGFDKNAWFGGQALDYRFRNARTILGDIFESEVKAHA